jgi:hypothetical protein
MNQFSFVLIIFALLAIQCSSSKSISDTENVKLDTTLRHLLAGDNADKSKLDIYFRTDGTKMYGVIVRSENAEELKALGISVTSVFGDVIVAHVTIEELRKIISLPSVRAVEVGSKNIIQQHQH